MSRVIQSKWGLLRPLLEHVQWSSSYRMGEVHLSGVAHLPVPLKYQHLSAVEATERAINSARSLLHLEDILIAKRSQLRDRHIHLLANRLGDVLLKKDQFPITRHQVERFLTEMEQQVVFQAAALTPRTMATVLHTNQQAGHTLEVATLDALARQLLLNDARKLRKAEAKDLPSLASGLLAQRYVPFVEGGSHSLAPKLWNHLGGVLKWRLRAYDVETLSQIATTLAASGYNKPGVFSKLARQAQCHLSAVREADQILSTIKTAIEAAGCQWPLEQQSAAHVRKPSPAVKSRVPIRSRQLRLKQVPTKRTPLWRLSPQQKMRLDERLVRGP